MGRTDSTWCGCCPHVPPLWPPPCPRHEGGQQCWWFMFYFNTVSYLLHAIPSPHSEISPMSLPISRPRVPQHPRCKESIPWPENGVKHKQTKHTCLYNWWMLRALVWLEAKLDYNHITVFVVVLVWELFCVLLEFGKCYFSSSYWSQLSLSDIHRHIFSKT